MSELVYCVPTELLPEPSKHAQVLTPELYTIVVEQGQFLVRDEVEEDETQRQIIPYAVVEYHPEFEPDPLVLLVERLKAGSETRLHNKLSIGLGGHINPQDDGSKTTETQKSATAEQDILQAALIRELREELVIGAFTTDVRALIHRSENAVERVHTGLLYSVKVIAPVSVRETHKLAGEHVPWTEVSSKYARLEGWSQATYEFLYQVRQNTS
jgi:predicted NUDIX family phosphoesterase